MNGLQPEDRQVRLWGWFKQLPVDSQLQLGRFFRRGRDDKTDFTKADWFTAMGFVVT